jgi:uncharacterized protein (DUF58 family)
LPLGAREKPGEAEVDFEPGFLESLERLRLLALRAAGGGLKEGHRLGAYKGGQLEFHDYRGYAPGDDLRYLDWNLYARLDKPFIKEFAREEAGTVHLLLDATTSMALGQPSKWTFARRLAALFAHVGWSARDVVRAYVYRRPGLDPATYPPGGRRGETAEFLEWLRREQTAPPAALQTGREAGPSAEQGQASSAAPAGAAGALLSAVRAFLRTAPVRGRVFLISDLWQEEDELADALRRLSTSGFDLAVVQVLAPEELMAPEPGEWRVLAAEEPGEVEVNLSLAGTSLYVTELHAHRGRIESFVRKRGGLYLMESSDTPIERVLIQALRERRWVT